MSEQDTARCAQYRSAQVFFDYVRKRLSDEDKRLFEVHLKHCGDCRLSLRVAEETMKLAKRSGV